MIELKGALISSNQDGQEKHDIAFDKGLNVIEYKLKTLFDFFSLQYQSLDEGQFIIDGKIFFPREDNSERLIVLLIKSKVFVLTTCFVMAKDEKEKFKDLQNQLALLRDLPLNDDKQKVFKIEKMMEIVASFKPSYVAIDNNDEINKAHHNLIKKVVAKYLKEIVFITLDVKPESVEVPQKKIEPSEEIFIEEGEVCHIDTGVGKIEQVDVGTIELVKQNKDLIKKVFKFNQISYLIAIVSILFSFLFLAIAPHYFVTNDIFMGVFLIASCVLFIVIAYLVALSSFDFMDNPLKNTKIRRIISVFFSEASAILAIALGIGAFFLLGQNNFLFDLSTYEFVYIIPAIVVSFFHFLIPLFAAPLRKFNAWVKSLFKKKIK